MATARNKQMDPTEELTRVGVLLLRRMLGTQSETVRELSRAGFGTTRIAELLGTTTNTVNQVLVKAKKPAARTNAPSAKGDKT